MMRRLRALIPHRSRRRPVWRSPVGTCDTHGQGTDQGSEIYLLESEGIFYGGSDCNAKWYIEKVSEMNGLTDLKETFRLNGEASLRFFKVEVHHISFVLAASLS